MKKNNIRNVLVLGMISILPNQYTEKKEIYPAALRDFYRLQALQEFLPNSIIWTMNNQPITNINVQPTHIFATISRRGAISIFKQFPNLRFDYVFLDYIRFPTAYMYEVYGKICSKNGFFQTLYKNNQISSETQIFIPMLNEKDSFCSDFKEWQIEKISWSKNLLARATAFLEKKNSTLLGGIKNTNELAFLDKNSPFLKIRKKKNVTDIDD